jgi:hypothetical protein
MTLTFNVETRRYQGMEAPPRHHCGDRWHQFGLVPHAFESEPLRATFGDNQCVGAGVSASCLANE